MKHIKGNIWSILQQKQWIVIPTNSVVKSNGEAVMGAGLALQAATRFPHLPKALGKKLISRGNHVFAFRELGIISFPTKRNYRGSSELQLIEQSAQELVRLINKMSIERVYLPTVGTGKGGLNWTNVEPTLERHLDDRFIIVHFVAKNNDHGEEKETSIKGS